MSWRRHTADMCIDLRLTNQTALDLSTAMLSRLVHVVVPTMLGNLHPQLSVVVT